MNAGTAVHERGYHMPVDVAVDVEGNRLFISDSGNHRILVYTDVSPSTLMNKTPTYVLGQSSFMEGGTTTSDLANPRGIAYTRKGYLYVADKDNNRIVRFNLSDGIQNGEAPEATMEHYRLGGTTIEYFTSPMELSYDDAEEVLYVSNSLEHRVVGIAEQDFANGADTISAFGIGVIGTGRKNFHVPLGMFIHDETLGVVDSLNSRVLLFDKDNIVDGSAHTLFGYDDFGTDIYASPPTQASLRLPVDMAFVSDNCSIFVSDTGNNRVLQFQDQDCGGGGSSSSSSITPGSTLSIVDIKGNGQGSAAQTAAATVTVTYALPLDDGPNANVEHFSLEIGSTVHNDITDVTKIDAYSYIYRIDTSEGQPSDNNGWVWQDGTEYAFRAANQTTGGVPLSEASEVVLFEAGNSCFLAGTLITLADGTLKSIEEMEIGDSVLAWDERTNATVAASVSALHTRFSSSYYEVKTDHRTLEVTGEHPFRVGNRWVLAEQLRPGDVLTLRGGATEAVRAITFVDMSVPVYNMTVSGPSTYFANGVLVHNKTEICDYDGVPDAGEGCDCDDYTCPGGQYCDAGECQQLSSSSSSVASSSSSDSSDSSSSSTSSSSSGAGADSSSSSQTPSTSSSSPSSTSSAGGGGGVWNNDGGLSA